MNLADSSMLFYDSAFSITILHNVVDLIFFNSKITHAKYLRVYIDAYAYLMYFLLMIVFIDMSSMIDIGNLRTKMLLF